jgi:hypothetical protein
MTPLLTALLVAIANYFYIAPLENKIEKLNDVNNIITDKAIKDTIFLINNFPKYMEIIKTKNKSSGLSQDPSTNKLERKEILSFFEPLANHVYYIYTFIYFLNIDKKELEDSRNNWKKFREKLKNFNNNFLSGSPFNKFKITENQNEIQEIEERFEKLIANIIELLKYHTKNS